MSINTGTDIRGLNANTTYTFYCYPINKNGQENTATQVTFTTMGNITSFSNGTATRNTIPVTFSGTYSKVRVYYSTTSGGTDNYSEFTGSSTTSGDISGLTSTTIYYLNIYPINSNGDIGTKFNTELNVTTSSMQQPSLYYAFNTGDVSGSNLKNIATGIYDASLIGTPSINTTTYKSGNGSLYLNGTNQYVSIPNSNSITFTTDGLTIASWFKISSSGWTRLFDFAVGRQNDNIGYAPGNGEFLYQGSNVKQQMSLQGKADNNWHHFVWTLSYAPLSSATSTWKMYIDGSNVYSTTTGYYPNITSRSSNFIGFSNWSSDGYTTGYIDDFRIYNTVLSQADVSYLYYTQF